MPRLSITDLNNMIGYKESDLLEVYKNFRNAHTSLYNKSNKWINYFNHNISKWNNMVNMSYESDYALYKITQRMYYESSVILSDIDLMESYTDEYLSCIAGQDKDMTSNIRKLMFALTKLKLKIIDKGKTCYDLYSQTYNRLEDYYEE